MNINNIKITHEIDKILIQQAPAKTPLFKRDSDKGRHDDRDDALRYDPHTIQPPGAYQIAASYLAVGEDPKLLSVDMSINFSSDIISIVDLYVLLRSSIVLPKHQDLFTLPAPEVYLTDLKEGTPPEVEYSPRLILKKIPGKKFDRVATSLQFTLNHFHLNELGITKLSDLLNKDISNIFPMIKFYEFDIENLTERFDFAANTCKKNDLRTTLSAFQMVFESVKTLTAEYEQLHKRFIQQLADRRLLEPDRYVDDNEEINDSGMQYPEKM